MHTPGPWKTVTEFVEAGIWVAAPDTSVVARVYEQGGLGLSNACLIAAAPDLLAALQAAESWVIGCTIPDCRGTGQPECRGCKVRLKVSKAIAKATTEPKE